MDTKAEEGKVKDEDKEIARLLTKEKNKTWGQNCTNVDQHQELRKY